MQEEEVVVWYIGRTNDSFSERRGRWSKSLEKEELGKAPRKREEKDEFNHVAPTLSRRGERVGYLDLIWTERRP